MIDALVGPGVVLDPSRTRHRAIAPVGARIVKLHPHGFVVVTQDGRGVLVHLGIDTVQLKGEGFTLLAAEGDAAADAIQIVAHGEVAAGAELFTWS
jgi:sugar PTS system EIIA component